jgi:hypothetical protein
VENASAIGLKPIACAIYLIILTKNQQSGRGQIECQPVVRDFSGIDLQAGGQPRIVAGRC